VRKGFGGIVRRPRSAAPRLGGTKADESELFGAQARSPDD
jgi:hypothetical protein